jgi:prepilin-type N-terminal cleavage/methylation domain-containing protein
VKRAGFTLIELLVVIAIIAILAAILFPVFLSAKEHGRMTRCLDNLKNLATALKLYADNNGGRMPSAHTPWMAPDWCGAIATANPTVNFDKGAVWQYTGRNRAIFLCPSDNNVTLTRVKDAAGNYGVFKDYPLSYSMNWALGSNKAVAACQGRDRVAVDSVRSPCRVLLVIHEGRKNIDDGCFYWISNTGNANLPSKVHYSGTTASYLDGHAKWLSYNTLLKERDDGYWDPLK